MRTLAIALVTAVLTAAPAFAVTSQEKMETCKVGAESQQLARRQALRLHQEMHGARQLRTSGQEKREKNDGAAAEAAIAPARTRFTPPIVWRGARTVLR